MISPVVLVERDPNDFPRQVSIRPLDPALPMYANVVTATQRTSRAASTRFGLPGFAAPPAYAHIPALG